MTINKKECLPKQEDFLKKYNISKDDFEKAYIKWEILAEIYSHYLSNNKNLEPTGMSVMERLRHIKEVHSLKMRIKNPEHLIEKIIRKRLKDQEREFNIETYQEQITDLIGIRVMHLFKDEWKPIHDNIMNTWSLHETPKAYVREGDSKYLEKNLENNGLVVEKHEHGYRSLHYILTCQLTKNTSFVELQVRTLFEEGWSEIDHQARYPYLQDNLLLKSYLSLFNRLAGSADEMGSFINILQNLIEDGTKKEAELKEAIAKLELEQEKKNELENKVNELTNISPLFAPGQHKTLYDYITGEIADTTPTVLDPSFYTIVTGNVTKTCSSCHELFTEYTSNLINLCPKCRLPIKLL